MSDETFWAIIAETKSDDQDTQSSQLEERLSQLNKAELIEFESTYREKLRFAYSWDLWAGAYIINGGCSDDGFDYFCDWLISRGRKVYEAALENPETLVDEATPWDTEFEDFRYIMIEVMENTHDDEFSAPTEKHPSTPKGSQWDEETVETKYPKLAEWVEESEDELPSSTEFILTAVSPNKDVQVSLGTDIETITNNSKDLQLNKLSVLNPNYYPSTLNSFERDDLFSFDLNEKPSFWQRIFGKK